MHCRYLVLGLFLGLCGSRVASAAVTSPSEHLGRPLGTDFKLADWAEVSSYYQRLARESARVETERIGITTEGRDFFLSVISSEANLRDRAEIQAHAAVLADPRGHSEARLKEAVRDGKVILLLSPQMHSTEAAGTEAAMRFAYTLATSSDEPWVSAREEVMVGIFPCTNPDGLDHVVHWYRENVGTPYEATGLLQLYQRYSGHDNNRDWFMLTQTETQLVTEQIYQVWRPQVYWDIHQQGSRKERMFVPPFRDPLNPNLDPAIIAGIGVIGGRALFDMTRAGLTGISTGVTYDMWWNGGNRNVPVRHNIVGLLTEAASVDIATPLFLRQRDLSSPVGAVAYGPSNQFPSPWPGGWWRLRDINEYQFQFGKSLVGTLAREPETWRRNALEAAQRAIRKGRGEGVQAWVVPSDNRDPDAVARLVNVLLKSGVEVRRVSESFEADGRSYPAGSLLILRDQPYGAHVKDLFEIQRYPAGASPYDVSGWTLPLLLGVRRVEVMERPETEAALVSTAAEAVSGFEGDTRVRTDGQFSIQSTGSWARLAARLREGKSTYFVYGGEDAGLFVSELGDARPVASGSEGSVPPLSQRLERLPRIGVYSPWQGSMDEGWMRYVLDANSIPYVSVRNEQIRAGQLTDFLDVLVVPSLSGRQLDAGRSEGSVRAEYTRGLEPEGTVAIEEFVRLGGRLVTVGSSSDWAIDLFDFPLVNVTRESNNRLFSCPGSVVRGVPVLAQRELTAGLPASVALFFSRSAAWRTNSSAKRSGSHEVKTSVAPIVTYGREPVLLSGWIQEPGVIAGRHAWVRARYGLGQVDLFGFRPQYRGWSQEAFSLLFRALFL